MDNLEDKVNGLEVMEVCGEHIIVKTKGKHQRCTVCQLRDRGRKKSQRTRLASTVKLYLKVMFINKLLLFFIQWFAVIISCNYPCFKVECTREHIT